MIFGLDGKDSALVVQLREAEAQLARRQRQYSEDLHMLDASIRRRVTSPDVLLWGAGSGFILGELTKKRAPAKHAREDDPYQGGRRSTDHEAPHEASAGTFQLMLRYIAIARPIIASVGDLLAPYLHKAHAEAVAQDHENAVRAVEEPVPDTPPGPQHSMSQPA